MNLYPASPPSSDKPKTHMPNARRAISLRILHEPLRLVRPPGTGIGLKTSPEEFRATGRYRTRDRTASAQLAQMAPRREQAAQRRLLHSPRRFRPSLRHPRRCRRFSKTDRRAIPPRLFYQTLPSSRVHFPLRPFEPHTSRLDRLYSSSLICERICPRTVRRFVQTGYRLALACSVPPDLHLSL